MRTITSRSIALLLGLALASAAAPATAEDDPRKKQADVPFQEGLRLHDKGKEEAALTKFREAHAIYPSSNALFQIARSEQLLHRDLDAIRDYREVLKSPVLHPKNKELALAHVAELESRLARVDVRGPAGLEVVVRGRTVVLPMATPLDIEAGSVEATGLGAVRYTARGHAETGRLLVLELAETTPSAMPAAPQATASPMTGSPPDASHTAESFWGVRSVTGLAVGGLGLVAVGVGVGYRLDQSSQEDRVDELGAGLSPSACRGAAPAPPCAGIASAADAADSSAKSANVFLIGGAAFVGVGAALVLSAIVWPHRRTVANGPRLFPSVSATRAELLLQSDF